MPNAEVFEINIVELPKLPKNAGNSMKELWVKFLSAKTKEELNMLTKQAPALKKAVNKLIRINASEERRYMAEMRHKAEMERDAFKKGTLMELATNMIAEGLDDTLIAKITKLSIVEIELLRKRK